MLRNALTSAALMLLILWPIQAQNFALIESPAAMAPVIAPVRLSTSAETRYLTDFALRGNLDAQGLLVESLDGTAVLADHNSARSFNPASVIKLGTSFAALYRWGADYRFETAFYTSGTINKTTKTLNGNLVFRSAGDPVLTQSDIVKLTQQVSRAGITRVTGDLVVSGPLTFDSYYTTTSAAKRLSTVLRLAGIRVDGKTRMGGHSGTPFASRVSAPLRDILLDQNRRSSNPMAERLGEALSPRSGDGPRVVEQFLRDVVRIPADDVIVGRTSGLDYNRLTPRATVRMLRELVRWLDEHNLQPSDIMPRAGEGTLRSRFTTAEYRDGLVGKTGTLPATDGGVSTLAGIAYTRDHGPVLFAIFNTKEPVNVSRRLQDVLMQDLIDESGGVGTAGASETLRRSDN
ncbi:MAG TPA: D-alanyl-D-alanine carboxypeptidase [Terriglobia bacterium]|nr:D-alanyl-D-alanine carboxypeptidase [Terriglobia bacterium]